MVARGDFAYHGDHLICPQGKVLRRKSFHPRSSSYQYIARQKDCQACPIKGTRLPPGRKQRYISLTMYHPLYQRARERNRTVAYRRERRLRQTVAEGTFASLDRLSWPAPGSGDWGRWTARVTLAALAHNVLKMVAQTRPRCRASRPSVARHRRKQAESWPPGSARMRPGPSSARLDEHFLGT